MLEKYTPMAQDCSSTPACNEENAPLMPDGSEADGQLVCNTPVNSQPITSQEGPTQPDHPFQAVKALQGFSGNLVKGVWQLSSDVAGKTTEIGSKVARSATNLGQEAVQSVTGFTQEVAESTAKLGQEATQSALSQAAVQDALLLVGGNTHASQVAKEASVEAYIKQVNLSRVQKFVVALKEKFPTKNLEELSQQIVVQQTLRITGNSAALSLIPGKLVEAMGFDQASLTLAQAEIIYQIADVYGLELKTPSRREEAFAIFDRTLRSARQMKMSMNLGVVPTLPIVGGLLSAIPILGGALNVGSDAFLISLTGDTACYLYKTIAEEKVVGETLKSFKQETQTRYKQRLW
jgi:hypothetical protein